jgi:hypothetical protein
MPNVTSKHLLFQSNYIDALVMGQAAQESSPDF